jgi:hypothetical protein
VKCVFETESFENRLKQLATEFVDRLTDILGLLLPRRSENVETVSNRLPNCESDNPKSGSVEAKHEMENLPRFSFSFPSFERSERAVEVFA